MASEQEHAWHDRRGHGDLREEIVRLEAEIDELTGVIERSRKVGLIANSAIVVGAMWLLASTVGALSFDPVALISAIAAVIGGSSFSGPTRVRRSKLRPASKLRKRAGP